MEYNSSIRSRLVEPVLDLANDRVEFRFAADEVIKTNMRLLNLGISTEAAANTNFNTKAGVISMLDEVTLYDNNEVLDSIRPADNWLSFHHNLVSNRKQIAIQNVKIGNSKNQSTNNSGQVSVYNLQPYVTNGVDTTSNFTLELKDLLPICRAADYLPTQLFKNLRLVIKFKKDATSLLFNVPATDTASIKRNPLLAVDMLNNDQVVAQVLSSYRGIAFNAIEYDSFVDPTLETTPTTLPAGGKQSKVSKRLFGLQGKFVNRLMISRTPMLAADKVADVGAGPCLISSGGLRAVCNIHPSYQLAVNGANMFVHEITDTAEIVAMTTDTWGNFGTTITGTSFGRQGIEDANYTVMNVSAADNITALTKTSSDGYFGCFVQNRIQSIDLSVGRLQRPLPAQTIAADSVYVSDQLVNVWAEVRKSIVLNGSGGYSIIYN